MVSDLMCMFLIHSELIFVYREFKEPSFTLLPMYIWFSQHQWLSSLSSLYFPGTFVKNHLAQWVGINFCVLYVGSLVYMFVFMLVPHCFYHNSFVVYFEIRYCFKVSEYASCKSCILHVNIPLEQFLNIFIVSGMHHCKKGTICIRLWNHLCIFMKGIDFRLYSTMYRIC